MVTLTPNGVTLAIHIAAGFLALFAGAGALATKKGGRRHRLSGRFFVYGMTVVAVTTPMLYVIDPTTLRLFLALVAVFSYYFVFSGYRVLSRKRPADEPGAVDLVAVGLMTLSGVGLLAMGGWMALDGTDFATVLLVFGVIATTVGVQDLRTFRADGSVSSGWMVEHLQRMSAGYIAAVSAFSAVNFTFLPGVVRWLWPTFLGVPVVVYLARKYQTGTGRATAA